MAYNTSFDVSNKADFVVDISATDAITGDDIDFTGADVSIVLSSTGDNCCPQITASIGTYITLVSSTVLELYIPAVNMSVLQPGTYQIDANYTLNGATFDLLTGTVAVRYSGAVLS